MTLDATVAGASADSYITVAVADGFAGADMGPEAAKWLDSKTTVADREKVLKRATREIDGYVRTGFPKYSATQKLRFPRSIDEEASSPLIPDDIQQATYLQAIYVLKNHTIIDNADARHARAHSQYSEPGSSGSIDEDSVNLISPRALHFLAGFRVASSARGGTVGTFLASSGFPVS